LNIKINQNTVVLEVTKNETVNWATEKNWICSKIAGHDLKAVFDQNGVYELAIDGNVIGGDELHIDEQEFNSFACDHLHDRIPLNHPCYFVAVGQFINKN
jgi:hypothetical protein